MREELVLEGTLEEERDVVARGVRQRLVGRRRLPELALRQEHPELLRVQVSNAIVRREERHDGFGVRLVFVESNLQIGRGVFPLFLQRDLLFDACGQDQNRRAELGLMLQALHDRARRKMPDEVLRRAATAREAVFDRVREETLMPLLQRRVECRGSSF